jgi:protease I
LGEATSVARECGRIIDLDGLLDGILTRFDEAYDALLLPGGVMSPDKLRMNPRAVEFVRSFVEKDKPVAAICHGPWTLVEAGVVRGRVLTSWPSLKTDIQNAGGDWADRETVLDGKLLTSRKPDDIPAFNREMIELFAQAAPRR